MPDAIMTPASSVASTSLLPLLLTAAVAFAPAAPTARFIRKTTGPILSRESNVRHSFWRDLRDAGRARPSSPQRAASVPQAGDDGDAFDWTAQWYPLSPVQDLSESSPNKLTLLGMDLAVWHDGPAGQWRAFADECPHRLVPLSEGRVVASTGRLQCAYHGWEFGGDGSCQRIPQLGVGDREGSAAVRSPKACCTSFPVRVEQGLVWVFATPDQSEAERINLPLIPQLDDPSYVDATDFFVRDMPYSWEVLVENLCDPSHIPFAHHGMMNGADRSSADKVDMVVTEETPRGFKARKEPYPTNGKYDVKFEAPCLLYYEMLAESMKDAHRKNAGALEDSNASEKNKQKTYIGLGTYCVPTSPGRCRIIARFPFRLPFPPVMWIIRRTPRWITHFSQNIVMDSDVVFLSSQDERLGREADRIRPGYYMPAKCDAMVSAFRDWLGRRGGGGPMWAGTPAARSGGEKAGGGWVRPRDVPGREGRDALLDRYRQHTDVCSSCRRAHRTLCALREACAAAGVCLLGAAAAAAGRTNAAGVSMAMARGRAVAVAAGLALLLAPRAILRPIIARMECAPWPRKKWIDADRVGFLPKRKQ